MKLSKESMAKGRKRSHEVRLMKPRYVVGARIGFLRITKVLGHFECYRQGRKSWHYSAVCENPVMGEPCGEVVAVTQKSLVERSSHATCNLCARRKQDHKKFKVTLPEGVPDFATLPVPDSIKTGPESY